LQRNIIVISGTAFLLFISLFAWYPLLSLHFRDPGASDAQVGLAYSVLAFGFALMQSVGGFIAERYGRKLPVVVPTFVFVPLYVLAGATRGWIVLLGALFLTNILSAIQWSAFISLLAESAQEKQRGRAFGAFNLALWSPFPSLHAKDAWGLSEPQINRLFVAANVASLGPTLGAYLSGIFGSAAPFWAALGSGLMMALSLRAVSATDKLIYSIGHSTRTLSELVSLLAAYDIEAVADVRRFPHSRHNPQFNKETLESELPALGIEYHWLGETLGGFRGGYTDYMSTEDFKRGLAELERIARGKRTAFMCAEKLFFRCHRRFIADALVEHGWRVLHIIEKGRKPYEHKLRA